MRTEQLRALLVIAEMSSLRAAAERLGVSQSSLSTSVQRLEAELGVTLLGRSRTGTTLTEAGRVALESVREVCRAEDDLRRVLREYTDGVPALVRVAAVTSAVNTVLPDALHDVLDDAGLEVQVRIGGSDDVITQVLDDGADLGVIACEPDVRPPLSGIVSETLLSAPVGIAMPVGHRLAGTGSVALADLRGERMIDFRPGYLMHQVGRRLAAKTTARVVSHVESTPEAVRMVSAGVGMCFVPRFSITAGEQVEWRALTDSGERIDLVLVRPARLRPSTGPARLADRIRWHSRRFHDVHLDTGGSANTAVRDTV
ncbi:LysR family transcriptional regulator [Gordonia sp. NPDC003376]